MPLTFAALDWGSVGVIGGAVYTTYQAITNNQIKNAILELKLSIQDRFASIEKEVAINYERHMTLDGVVKSLQLEIIQLHKDIAFRDGRTASQEESERGVGVQLRASRRRGDPASNGG